MKIYLNYLLPLLLLIISSFVRFYNLPNRAIFTADEEYQATYAQTLIADFHPIWIGVSAADTGFYLGPYFTYLTAGLLKLNGGDPLLANYFSAALGVVTSLLVYYLGYLLKGSLVGLGSGLLYSLSPLVVYLDQRYWNPTPSMFLVVLFVISLLKAQQNRWWLVLTSFVLGSIWHVHLSLVPLYVVATIYLWQHRKKITATTLAVIVFVHFILLAPLIIFDFNHNFSNILTPLRMIEKIRANALVSNGPNPLLSLGDSISRSIYLSPGTESGAEIRPYCAGSSYTNVHLYVQILSLLLMFSVFIHFKLWREPKIRTLLLTLSTMTVATILYPGIKPPYYTAALYPLLFVTLALVYPRILLVVLPLFVFTSLHTLSTTNQDYGVAVKKDLIFQVTDFLGSSSYNLSEVGTCYRYGGWRYLFKAYSTPPNQSSADGWIGWLYPEQIMEPGEYQVLVGATNEILTEPSALATFRSGAYTAVIKLYEP